MKYSTLLRKAIGAFYAEKRRLDKQISELVNEIPLAPPGGRHLIEEEIRKLQRRKKWVNVQITNMKRRRDRVQRGEQFWEKNDG